MAKVEPIELRYFYEPGIWVSLLKMLLLTLTPLLNLILASVICFVLFCFVLFWFFSAQWTSNRSRTECPYFVYPVLELDKSTREFSNILRYGCDGQGRVLHTASLLSLASPTATASRTLRIKKCENVKGRFPFALILILGQYY